MVNNDSNKIITEYESVDLGLSSGNLWSTCNLGAVCPYESGDYFAWGELYPKETYTFSNYLHSRDGILEKYCIYRGNGNVDNKILLDREDDAATVQWGNEWTIPTMEDFIELIEGCEWSSVDNYERTGVAGFIGISLSNLNEIFFPYAGKKEGDKKITPRSALYWSSSSYETPYGFSFFPDSWEARLSSSTYRYDGCSIRPIKSTLSQDRNCYLINSKEKYSISQILGPWKGNLPLEDRIAMELYNLYNLPIMQYSISDVAFLLRQDLLMEYVVPIAIDVLKRNPFIMTDYFRGDLLSDLLSTKNDIKYWKSHEYELKMVFNINEMVKRQFNVFDVNLCEQRRFSHDFDLFWNNYHCYLQK